MKERLYSLQSLRGIAALLVLLHHTTLNASQNLGYKYLGGVFRFGNLGVDLFFILSGFLMFSIHSSDIGQKKKFLPFIKKRFVRVYPIYWFVTLIIIPLFFLFPSFGEGYERNISVIIKSLLLIPQGHDPILGVGWSLVYEVYFYLLFALMIILGKRVSNVILFLWVAISVVLMTFPAKGYLFNFLFNPIIFEFLMGCLAAFILTKVRFKHPLLIFSLGVVLLLTSVWFLYSNSQVLDREGLSRVLLYGVPSLFILLGMVSMDTQGKIKNLKILTYLGDASYSIYLVHTLVLSLTSKVFMRLSVYETLSLPVATTLCVLISVLAGFIFHSLFERPLLNFSRSKLIINRGGSLNQ
ncbi:acyltransferase [Paenibacillus sp. 7124]|uniref:Acyltransferase n=1 Tax=Paenibacillus apii TaxID=1850370 RepID=A0A6M1PD97_9BACL|nr:acyltransferase [Paenibacillus apii]NGM81187.1 acyltransferase [Paenibacillus apii]